MTAAASPVPGVTDPCRPATARLAFRRFDAGDVDNVLGLDGDGEVMRFLGRPADRRQVLESVLPALVDGGRCDGCFGTWAAETRTTGAFVGWFCLVGRRPDAGPMDLWAESSDDRSVASLGYRLCRDAWGHGYATEGARELMRLAFATAGVRRLVATTMAVNLRSRRLLERLGFTHVRTAHVDWDDPLPGTEHGEAEYEVTVGAWAAEERKGRPGHQAVM